MMPGIIYINTDRHQDRVGQGLQSFAFGNIVQYRVPYQDNSLAP